MLAIDCGNTRIKWGRFSGGRLEAGGAGALDDDATFTALGEALAAVDDRVLVANVAGTGPGQRIAALVTERSRAMPEFVRVEAAAHGIVCGYRDPATLGVDRWLAMIAARRRTRGAFAVVSAGTAVTFDAVDGEGRHLGGLILPSEALMHRALADGTGQIALMPRAGGAVQGLALLGRSTAAAVAHGSRLALAAALDRAVAVVAGALAAELDVLLTGGDAALLASWLESRARLSADLVLEGLAAVAEYPEQGS